MLILDIFRYLESKSEDKKLCISTFSLYFLKENIIFRETTPGFYCNFFDLLDFFCTSFLQLMSNAMLANDVNEAMSFS